MGFKNVNLCQECTSSIQRIAFAQSLLGSVGIKASNLIAYGWQCQTPVAVLLHATAAVRLCHFVINPVQLLLSIPWISHHCEKRGEAAKRSVYPKLSSGVSILTSLRGSSFLLSTEGKCCLPMSRGISIPCGINGFSWRSSACIGSPCAFSVVVFVTKKCFPSTPSPESLKRAAFSKGSKTTDFFFPKSGQASVPPKCQM